MIGQWIKALDGLLRGEATKLASLRRGEVEVPTGGMLVLILLMGAFYGVCMGCFAAFNRPVAEAMMQMIASAGKIPLLFLLTLLVTFPSLYVFNALIGSRLTLAAVWQLLIATLAVMLAVLASLGPVVAFFSVSTTGYNFMLMFNVLICAASGFLGLKFLLFTLHRLTLVLDEKNAPPVSPASKPEAISTGAIPPRPKTPEAAKAEAVEFEGIGPKGTQTEVTRPESVEPEGGKADSVKPIAIALEDITPATYIPPLNTPTKTATTEPQGALAKVEGPAFSGNVTMIFRIWVVVFALVGAQMSWVLRPFIGSPGVPFTLLRERDSNFFEAVWRAFWQLLGA